MNAIVHPSRVEGKLKASPSKSLMQRVCAAALIREGTTIISNAGNSDDEQVALQIIRALGATVSMEEEGLVIRSRGIMPVAAEISCGESGLSLRMFTCIAAVSSHLLRMTARGSLLMRPQSFFGDIFPRLGVHCRTAMGYAPIEVKGPLQPVNLEIDGSVSSQFLTGLLMAYAASKARDVSIMVHRLKSRPYIDLTLSVMEQMGLHSPVNRDYREFYFPSQSISPFANDMLKMEIEGDWSNAAFMLVAAAIGGAITLEGLDLLSRQGDRQILEVLKACGAEIRMGPDHIMVGRGALKSFEFDATDHPDLFPPLVALACYCRGRSLIYGVHRLLYKESNRAETLVKEFSAMGARISVKGDVMIVENSRLHTAAVDSNRDHRIAMACAVASLGGGGPVTIRDAGSVNKSYPLFWDHLRQVGAVVT